MQPFRRMRPAFWAFLFGLFIGWQMGAETPPEPPPPPKPAIRTAAVPGPTPSPAATAPSATVRATPDLLPSPADRAAPAESARGGAHAAPGGPVPAAVPRTPSAWDSPSALRTVDAAGPAAPTASPEPRAALSAAVAVSGQLPDPPFAVLIPKSPPPLPPGWPAQPPRPVGVMSLQECLDYIKSRQWSVQSDPRSQSIACQPQPPPQPLLLGAECHALSARAPFSVELCWDPATGEGRMRIEKRSGCAEAEAFTEDADTARDVRARLGPDSLRVRLEGPEVLVLDMAHEGACVYTGRFHVTTSGWFTLQCTHLFDQYHAVTELKPKTRYVARSLTEGRYRVGLPLQKEAPPAPALPCRDLWGAPARWWRPPDVRPYVDPFPPWKFPRTPGKNLAQADSWGSDARWTPYNCTWAPLAQSAARACFAGARVLFIGDSMTRSFFYPTLNRLWEDRIVGNPKITVADGPKKVRRPHPPLHTMHRDPVTKEHVLCIGHSHETTSFGLQSLGKDRSGGRMGPLARGRRGGSWKRKWGARGMVVLKRPGLYSRLRPAFVPDS